jgi:DNA helicase-4
MRGKVDYGPACRQLLERLDGFLGGIAEQWRTDAKPRLKALVLWRYNYLDPFVGRIPKFEHLEVEALSFPSRQGVGGRLHHPDRCQRGRLRRAEPH